MRQTIHFQEQISAPVETVFARFADHDWFVRLFGGRCRRVAVGDGHDNGVGSVRRIGYGALALDETIVVFEPNERIHYQVTRGGPLENHLGTIEFRAQAGGTFVDYRIEFDGKPRWIGPPFKAGLELIWRHIARRRLARLGA